MAARLKFTFGISLWISIPIGTTKIVFYNNYDSQNLILKTHSSEFSHETAHKGVSSICVCNKTFMKFLGNENIKVQVHQPSMKRKERYYLRMLQIEKGQKGFVYICVEQIGNPLPLPFLCMMQVRSKFYEDCGYKTLYRINEPLPEPVREMIVKHAHILKPVFKCLESNVPYIVCNNTDHLSCN